MHIHSPSNLPILLLQLWSTLSFISAGMHLKLGATHIGNRSPCLPVGQGFGFRKPHAMSYVVGCLSKWGWQVVRLALIKLVPINSTNTKRFPSYSFKRRCTDALTDLGDKLSSNRVRVYNNYRNQIEFPLESWYLDPWVSDLMPDVT